MGLRQCRSALAILATLLATTAAGQALESVLMPGKVISGHAKFEQECDKCHVKFDKSAQDALCRDCHKQVAQDIAKKTGYHGRIRIEVCRSCHTDHKGRDVNVAAFEPKTFDHTKTDFVLGGAHARSECQSCHLTGHKYREAPTSCNGCHRKDDRHKGALGVACADCHTQVNWKESQFDHRKTRFPLAGKHVDTPCKSCHAVETYRGAPLTCVACHKKDDKQHRGRLGERCETCHSAKTWSDVAAFQHDRDTKFALRGAHRAAKCETCHTAPPLQAKTPTNCYACHKADDKHNATLGSACGDCHTERGWKETRFDHETAAFKLRGKHADVECRSCHRDATGYKGAPQTCIGCHQKDDAHRARYGEQCASCHSEKSWRDIVFRHDRDTKYALAGKHMRVKCDSCHIGHVYRDKLATDCYACHRKDDKHNDQLGRRCDACHDTTDWKRTVRFDHNASRFALLGRHAQVECKNCHASPAFRDAPRACVSCHAKDDRHKGTLGSDCAQCHNPRDWRIWDFDHTRRTRFALDGAHGRVTCAGCHRAPAPVGKPIPALGTTCVACHRGDDPHSGDFGAQCERCHRTGNWRDIKPFGSAGDAPAPWPLATASRTIQ